MVSSCCDSVADETGENEVSSRRDMVADETGEKIIGSSWDRVAEVVAEKIIVPSSSESLSDSSDVIDPDGAGDGVIEKYGGVPPPAPTFKITLFVSCWRIRSSILFRVIFDLQAPLSRCAIIPPFVVNLRAHVGYARHRTRDIFLCLLASRCAASWALFGNVLPHSSHGISSKRFPWA